MSTKARTGRARPAKEQILRAARTLFAERGFRDTTVREIARRAGVNGAAINYYYDSKEALYVAVFEEAYERFRQPFDEMLGGVRDQASWRAALEAWFDFVLELFLLDTPRSKFAVGDLSSMGRDGRVLSGVAVKSPETFAALTLTSLDTEPTSVERARRVLVCLVGNSRNEAAVIQGRTIVDPGWEKSRAVLAEPLEATLAFPTSRGPMKVYKLSTRTGERQGELATNADGSFTIPKSAHTIYFEVVREE